ncbi:MAG: OadG-related small transporter subunit [Bacteroidales bacterium]|jgi:Na+-transporting methylmalonyl-CoA/oxaloacetate decarboxylase gamma subunit|nr:OadG-related small transporter subunit [Bacteroidales bacterium]OQA84380.1 MAG: hypothetical protein BWY27_01528 [Bacteroidetes bacterium ADurb.Bin234]MDD2687224.1 OadG-related small transporter subunit [Bacteroidales bacterium]MDD3330163.1 OadG-related small transporter subunit [Bacteroidales bacterium]MDD3691247.1 OadG-related small transporter subunit [Bacteroidales bacterium]
MIDYSIVNSALLISGIGMVGIFVFMMIFYFVIKLIDKFFPAK